jgi:hypothetical protein
MKRSSEIDYLGRVERELYGVKKMRRELREAGGYERKRRGLG